ncbi:MAG TPA: PQQ-binding-like beta-propeller repeat protein, partial [Vicinamibacterales bacterium]|nr:PQQ-binding-like beta-propeller repeat protein [Vicinamibacterales bacterium]
MITALLLAFSLQAPDGAKVYEDHCARCHSSAVADARTPQLRVLREKTPQDILDELTKGKMQLQGQELTPAERTAVAGYLGAAAAQAAAVVGKCTTVPPFDPSKGSSWTSWSPDLTNARFQPQAGISGDQIPKLALKWAFGFPNSTVATGQPTVAGGRVFVGSTSGTVYSLDAATGCIVWTFQAKARVRAGIVIGPRPGMPNRYAVYIGDGRSNAYALDATTGEQLWTRNVEDHKSANITGTPVLYQDRLYIPVSSSEEAQGANPAYECCTFRGSLVALDASTGALVWKTYTINAEAKPVGKNKAGATRWGPAGAGIWSSPTVDPKRKVVYAATGNMYTEPQQPTSDSIMAFDIDTGAVKWISQVTPQDVFVVGCGALAGGRGSGANCPEDSNLGPDYDFGNAPMLAKAN